MSEYQLPGALVLLLVVLFGARALQRRGWRRARSAAPDTVSRAWQRASSLFEMVRPARQTQPGLDEEELRVQREAAEEAAKEAVEEPKPDPAPTGRKVIKGVKG